MTDRFLRYGFACVALGMLGGARCTEPSAPRTEAEPSAPAGPSSSASERIPVVFDTDANNEVDDQHALAYLIFSPTRFEVLGVTVNATDGGGAVHHHYAEAHRVMRLCGVADRIPLVAGAGGTYDELKDAAIAGRDYPGKNAVDFIIQAARKVRRQRMLLLAVGKLTNVALALRSAPDIAGKVRIVWLGSNYPEPGEYNLRHDTSALSYLLGLDVPFDIVTVRYDRPDGASAVQISLAELRTRLAGVGPRFESVTGRHGGRFERFGDYGVSLFENAQLYGDPPGRALFDVVAVAVVKEPRWGERVEIGAPLWTSQTGWQARPANPRRIGLWQDFARDEIVDDFIATIAEPGSSTDL